MEKKLRLIETANYILGVSGNDDELYNTSIQELINKGWVIGYKSKGDAPELDLPLLPERIVEDDVDKLACKLANENKYVWENTETSARGVFRMWAKDKSANKTYSEDDLRNAIAFGINTQYTNLTPKGIELEIEKFIQSLKQSKTPKWFVAEMKTVWRRNTDRNVPTKDDLDEELKTTTINGKTYLVGTYLNE
jgi:hypothetical protein